MPRTKEYYEKKLKELELVVATETAILHIREAANKAIGELRKFRELFKEE